MVVTGMVVATVVVGATAEVGGNVDVATVTGVVAVLGVVAVVGGSAKVDAAASDAGDDPSASFGAPDPVHAPTAAVATRQILITFSIDVTYPTLVRPAGNPGELARSSHLVRASHNGRRQTGCCEISRARPEHDRFTRHASCPLLQAPAGPLTAIHAGWGFVLGAQEWPASIGRNEVATTWCHGGTVLVVVATVVRAVICAVALNVWGVVERRRRQR